MATPLEILTEVFELHGQGRLKSAKSKWLTLPEEFRKKCMKFAIYILSMEHPEDTRLGFKITLETKDGVLTLDDHTIGLFSVVLPELARG